MAPFIVVCLPIFGPVLNCCCQPDIPKTNWKVWLQNSDASSTQSKKKSLVNIRDFGNLLEHLSCVYFFVSFFFVLSRNSFELSNLVGLLLGARSLAVAGGRFGHLQRTHQCPGREPPMVESLEDLSCSEASWPSAEQCDLQRNGGSHRVMEVSLGQKNWKGSSQWGMGGFLLNRCKWHKGKVDFTHNQF